MVMDVLIGATLTISAGISRSPGSQRDAPAATIGNDVIPLKKGTISEANEIREN